MKNTCFNIDTTRSRNKLQLPWSCRCTCFAQQLKVLLWTMYQPEDFFPHSLPGPKAEPSWSELSEVSLGNVTAKLWSVFILYLTESRWLQMSKCCISRSRQKLITFIGFSKAKTHHLGCPIRSALQCNSALINSHSVFRCTQDKTAKKPCIWG